MVISSLSGLMLTPIPARSRPVTELGEPVSKCYYVGVGEWESYSSSPMTARNCRSCCLQVGQKRCFA